MNIDDIKIDRNVVKSFESFEDAEKDSKAAWHAMTPLERLEALELMRQIAYGYSDETSEGVQRILTVVENPGS